MSDEPAAGADYRIRVSGYSIIRSAMYLRRHGDNEVGTTWALMPAIADEGWDMVIIGDLTVRSSGVFGGVQVATYITLEGREVSLGDDDWELADSLLERHAPEVSAGAYDFAAMAMRGLLTGVTFPPSVQTETPSPELRFARDAKGSTVVDYPHAE